MNPDLLIVGGTVIDGTGAPGYAADVGVYEGRLTILDVGTEVTAGRLLNAKGKVIAPGFIDLHSHSGLTLLSEPNHGPKLRQGVTTEVIGVDGNSFAPFTNHEDLRQFSRMYAGLDGRPDLSYDWDTVASYLSRFDRRSGVNVAMLVGNSALRIAALGWNRVDADPRAIESMRSMLREGMEEGAFGLSTGLDYAPGSYASTDELSALAAEAAAHGGIYHTHVRYQLGDRYLDPFREAIAIGRAGDCPVHVTHLYRRTTFPGGAQPMLDLIDNAGSDGLDITFDAYPYPWSSTTLLILLPQWIQEGGPDAILERLTDPTIRMSIRKDVAARADDYGGDSVWERVRVGGFRRDGNVQYEAWTIADIARIRGDDPTDVICDLLVTEDLHVNEVAATQDEGAIPQFITHPRAMIGTDSIFLGVKPSPRTFGSFPKILGDYVRQDRLLTLEGAVRKMTSQAAVRLGLVDRGVIRDGAIADVVIFDPAAVSSPATYDNPNQQPTGINYVLVGGQIAIDDGQTTGVIAGRALRSGRADR